MHRFAAVILVLISLPVGCVDRAPEGEAGSPPIPSPTSSSSVRSNIFTSEDPCPPDDSATFGDDAGCVSSATGAFDGAPGDEELVVYARLDANGFPRSWHIAAVSEGRVTSRRYLQAANDITYPRVIGATDFDRDGDDEALVSVVHHPLHGVVAQDLALFVLGSDQRIVRLSSEGGEEFKLTSFNIGRLGEGARCEDIDGDERRELILTRLWSVDRQNRVWKSSERRYEWVGNKVRFVGRKTGTLRVSGYNDPALDPYFYVRCDEVHVP